MALSDLLLLATIVLVLAILCAGCFVLVFQKRFSFLRRPYPETGMRLSRRLGVPAGAPMDTTDETGEVAAEEIAEQHSGAVREMPENWEVAPRQNDAVFLPPSSQTAGSRTPFVAHGVGTVLEETAEKIAGELYLPGYEQPAACEGELRRDLPSIPWSYGKCNITALVRDPYWLFVYWEINEVKQQEIARRYGPQAWAESWPVLRVYDATNLYFFDSRHYSEIAINDYANNWYVCTGQPNRTYCIELGRVRPDGSFIFLARSNLVSTPRDQISEVIDEEWLLLPEYAARLYRRIGNIYPGPSSPGFAGPAEYVSSPGFAGPGGPGGVISSPLKW